MLTNIFKFRFCSTCKDGAELGLQAQPVLSGKLSLKGIIHTINVALIDLHWQSCLSDS